MTALLALLLALPARAVDLEWKTTASTAASVGTETLIGYRVELPASSRLEPDVLGSSTTDFIVVSAGFDASSAAWVWTLLPVEEGRLAFKARWTLDGQPLESPPVEMLVRTPDVSQGETPNDIKPPRAARPPLWPWLLAALLALGAWQAWRYWKRRRAGRDRASVPAEPPLPPQDRARRALKDLQASGLWERGEFAAYYLRLTDLLREYLDSRYGEPATAMTSGEVARMVRSRTADLRIATTVREVLNRADLVKFARLTPGRDEGPSDAGLVGSVIDDTTPDAILAGPEGPPE
ncbi:MAG: hypothetical protein A2506_11770 [Elusimicrobia bacterium RIFOXYD12_FULL_66_9]|nr:MAG: hypothetical protein A2506_11770 [Elusimicrobia bacterium RIFOXYD12_FULL_66_9]